MKEIIEYWLEDKKVTREEYEAFNKTLTEIEGTYHCAKTVDGGRNDYKATDPSGATWICKSVSKGNMERKSIEKKV